MSVRSLDVGAQPGPAIAGRAEAGEVVARASARHEAALAVLLVEDSPLLADRLCEMLGAMPEIARVHVVDREAAAVEELGPWDALVVDLHLKQGTGFGVLRALRRFPDLRPLVVVFTNHDVPGYRRRAEIFGIDHFLDKARDFERLAEVLRELHRKRRAAPANA